MIVLIFTPFISRSNGGSATALDAAEALTALGHEVHFVLSEGTPSIHRIVRRSKPTPPVSRSHLHATPRWVRFPVAAERHGPRMPRSVSDLRSTTVRVGLTALRSFDRARSGRSVDRLLSRADLLLDAGGLGASNVDEIRTRSQAVVISNHAGSVAAYDDFFLSRQGALGTRMRYIDAVDRYDGLLVQSDDTLDEMRLAHRHIVRKAHLIWPSCQEPAVHRARLSPSPFRAGRRAIVSIGSIQHRKAQHLSIEAFTQIAETHPTTDLHFVGAAVDHDYQKELEALVRHEGLEERVVFHGHRSDHLRFLAHGDVLVLSSRAEGVSRAIREAMLAGTAIVASDIPGTRGAVDHDSSALLFGDGSSADLAGALQSVLDDDDLRQRLADGARVRYFERHSWSRYLTAWSELCATLQGLGR